MHGRIDTSRSFLYTTSMTLKSKLLFLIVCAGVLTMARPAFAYERADYQARAHTVPRSVTMQPGETKTVTVKFTNTGKAIWNNDDEHFVSVYTQEPKYRESMFAHTTWLKPEQPTKMKNTNVFTARVGVFKIILQAPRETGTYTEHFALTAEDKTWIKGGDFVLNIIVADPPKETAAVVAQQKPAATTPPKAQILSLSRKKVEARGGQAVTVRAFIKNIGNRPWNVRELKAGNGVRIATISGGRFAHTSWVDTLTPLRLSSGVVSPNATDILTFTFAAPPEKGNYVTHFVLMADNELAEGGEISIPITVTEDAPALQMPVTFSGTEQFGSEPSIRVGLFKLEDTQHFIATADYRVKDGTGAELGAIPVGATVAFSYDKKNALYRVVGAGLNIQSSSYIRFEPADGSGTALFTLPDRERRVSWNKSLNYNKYRGALELRYGEKNNTVWVINELPMEYYLKGLAETSNNQPEAFHKALVIAARTYAYYHMQSGTENGNTQASLKHDNHYFHLDATYDQVYQGAERETSFANVNRAVDETRGLIATYGGEIAVTPYFTRSDGRTRSNLEVWRIDRPWLQSVVAHYDKGKTKLGHGVGMSAQDAIQRADKEGVDYETLLKYYYRGIELVKKWN